VFSVPIVIEAICTVAATIWLAGVTTTVAQASMLEVPDVAVAQIATPGEAVTPVTSPEAETEAAAELLELHATVGVTPAAALTAAVSVIDWPTVISAELGATCTLVIAPVFGPTTLTLSPHAAATIAVAATKRDERRTFMNDPLEVKSDSASLPNMPTRRRLGNPL
jgi:hypothetical protein